MGIIQEKELQIPASCKEEGENPGSLLVVCRYQQRTPHTGLWVIIACGALAKYLNRTVFVKGFKFKCFSKLQKDLKGGERGCSNYLQLWHPVCLFNYYNTFDTVENF